LRSNSREGAVIGGDLSEALQEGNREIPAARRVVAFEKLSEDRRLLRAP
jgi:hypothetical protein